MMKEITKILTNKEIKALGFRVVGSAFEWYIEKDIKNVFEVTISNGIKATLEIDTTPDERLKHLAFETQKEGREYFTKNIGFITGRMDFVLNLPIPKTEVINSTDITFESVDNVYWRHIKVNGKDVSFVHNGVTYTREAWPIKSNSGKSNVGWHVIYRGNNSTMLSNDTTILNRRNDPARNWGLGRS